MRVIVNYIILSYNYIPTKYIMKVIDNFSNGLKKLKKVKKEKVEDSPQKQRKHYVKKERKSRMFACSSCDYSSDYHSQIDQHTFKHHSSLCTQVCKS